MRETEDKILEALQDLLDHVRAAVGEESSLEVEERGTLAFASWENGIPLSEVLAAVQDVPGIRWRQKSQTEMFLHVALEGVSGYRHPMVALHRNVSTRALAYACMELNGMHPCECNDLQEYPDEVHEQYRAGLNRPDADTIAAHPGLQDSGYTPTELDQMAEVLAVLVQDGETEDATLEEVFCEVGHLAGLHHLACAGTSRLAQIEGQ